MAKRGRKKAAPVQTTRAVSKKRSWQPLIIPHMGDPDPGRRKRRSRRLSGRGGFRTPTGRDVMDNLLNGGSVAMGLIGGNAIRAFVPVKQPLIQSLINFVIGMIVTMVSGKQKKIALVGAGVAGNGLMLAARELFPNIPYLSGEVLKISAQDVRDAISTGAITQQEGAALLQTMSPEESESDLLGTMYEYAGLEDKFVTTQDY